MPQEIPQNIETLSKYLDTNELNRRIINYKKTRGGEYLLVLDFENNGQNLETVIGFAVFKTDRYTGKRGGYIGQEVCRLSRADCSESWIYNAAQALFKGV